MCLRFVNNTRRSVEKKKRFLEKGELRVTVLKNLGACPGKGSVDFVEKQVGNTPKLGVFPTCFSVEGTLTR